VKIRSRHFAARGNLPLRQGRRVKKVDKWLLARMGAAKPGAFCGAKPAFPLPRGH